VAGGRTRGAATVGDAAGRWNGAGRVERVERIGRIGRIRRIRCAGGAGGAGGAGSTIGTAGSSSMSARDTVTVAAGRTLATSIDAPTL